MAIREALLGIPFPPGGGPCDWVRAQPRTCNIPLHRLGPIATKPVVALHTAAAPWEAVPGIPFPL